ncbi:ASK1 [Candida pseudojiufengensis]|uniref:ASK1 n=1 Tax=Candida pseudojiufengensis TaxID=497109 RepID=UPI002225A48C|nr:ASK1 [Candida pseudojiufengensis]KAI5962130.1 ASK1 [Candida pseudojiufengensis]
MKRLSIAPPSSRRKSTFLSSEDYNARKVLEQLDQDTTLILQEIDKNISRANAIINDKLKPVLQEYGVESLKVWNNTSFWKKFFEQSANVELNSYETPIDEVQTNILSDKDQEEEIIDIQQPKNTTLLNSKRTNLRHITEEDTATWSTEQKNSSYKQVTSSTPQRTTRFQISPQRSTRFASSSIPSTRNFKLSDNINLQPPTSNSNSRLSPSSSRRSPQRVSTIRQSLDAYHRISISPKKIKTPVSARRTSIIQNILNSSPTLPSVPILKSDIVEQTTSPHSNQQFQSSSQQQQQPQQLQKFPNTQRYSSTPQRMPQEDDYHLDPPHVQQPLPQQHSDSSDEPLPELSTSIVFTSSGNRKRNRDEDNVFLEKDNNNNSSHSKSLSQIFNESLNKLRKGDNNKNNESDDVLNQDQGEQTGEFREEILEVSDSLGPFKNRWEKLTNLEN